MYFSSERGKSIEQKSSLKTDSWGKGRTLISKRQLSLEVLLASVFDTTVGVNWTNVNPEKLEQSEYIWKQILHRWREMWEVSADHLILIKRLSIL